MMMDAHIKHGWSFTWWGQHIIPVTQKLRLPTLFSALSSIWCPFVHCLQGCGWSNTERHLHACPWEQVHWSNLCAKDSQSEDSWHKVREKGAMAFCKVQVFWITKIWNIILNKIIKINPVTTEKCTLAVLDNKITKHVWIMRDLRWLNARSNAHWPVRLSFVCRSSRLQCLFPS